MDSQRTTHPGRGKSRIKKREKKRRRREKSLVNCSFALPQGQRNTVRGKILWYPIIQALTMKKNP